MTDNPELPERHKDKDRNRIINQTVTDLDNIINRHDPEVDNPIKDGVWNRLDKMGCDLSDAKDKRIAELKDKNKQLCQDFNSGSRARSKQKDRIAELEAKLAKALVWMHDARTALDYVPEYHDQGMGCGLEDRCIGDPYEAMQFGWDQAMDRVYDEQVNPSDEILRQALAELKGTD